MEPIISAQPAGPEVPLITETDSENFVHDVIEASQETPVIVDFWAPWCGPCKQLTPVLEKLVQQAGGAVRLVKVNIDENPDIAQQLRVQSIPTVFAFAGGRPVDGFLGAQPESQVKAMVDRLAQLGGGTQGSPVREALDQAKAALEAGDAARAANLYDQVARHEPENVEAAAGIARCLIAAGDPQRARAALDALPQDVADEPEVQAARAVLELAEASAKAGDPAALAAKVEADPNDHEARFDLALALFGRGDGQGAIEALLEIIRRDRGWRDEAARTQLLKFFDALGSGHPVTVAGRRKLSSILFA